jgi:hypothetical protein
MPGGTAERRSKLLPVEDALAAWQKLVAAFRAKYLALLAPEFAAGVMPEPSRPTSSVAGGQRGDDEMPDRLRGGRAGDSAGVPRFTPEVLETRNWGAGGPCTGLDDSLRLVSHRHKGRMVLTV